MEFVTKKYWFTYHFYDINQKTGNLYPCGGSFDKDGAKGVLKAMTDAGRKPAKIICKMISGLPYFDWNNVLNVREIKFS